MASQDNRGFCGDPRTSSTQPIKQNSEIAYFGKKEFSKRAEEVSRRGKKLLDFSDPAIALLIKAMKLAGRGLMLHVISFAKELVVGAIVQSNAIVSRKFVSCGCPVEYGRPAH